MAEGPGRPILEALMRELGAQGHPGAPLGDPARLTTWPIRGAVDVARLAQAVELALIDDNGDERGVTPGALNATNDG